MARFVNIIHAGLTDVGVKRSHNQDALAIQPAPDTPAFTLNGHVFIVADGMGGHAVGEKASAMAVREIPLAFKKHVQKSKPAAAIRTSFKETNAGIFAIGQNNPEFKGLGTTATALFIRDEGVWLGHVGDSRTYRIRGAKVEQLTFDHSWVWEVARRQGLDPDELGDFKRNVIIRSLGPDNEVEADVEGPHPIVSGDQYLMCSDGLSNVVSQDEIGAVVSTFPPEEACRHLIALANLRGGPDNITCLIVQIRDREAAGLGSRLRRLFDKTIGRLIPSVPWPFLALSLGVILAGVSVWLRMEEEDTFAVLAFLTASMVIVLGLVGLYHHLRKRAESGEDGSDGPSELNVYKSYGFEIQRPLIDRFRDFEAKIKDDHKDVTLDPELSTKTEEEIEGYLVREDWHSAFKARFLSLMRLADAIHKNLDKSEAFKPNWVKS